MDETFEVTQYPTNERWAFMCEAIKNAEPAVRVKGRAIDWDVFNQMVDDGSFAANMEEAVKNLSS